MRGLTLPGALVIITAAHVRAQPVNDDCSGAIFLTPATVWTPVLADVFGATQSAPAGGCAILGANAANDDVWFAFVATEPFHQVRVEASDMFYTILETYVGTCGALVPWECRSEPGPGAAIVQMSGLVVGDTAYIRVFDSDVDMPFTTTFDICVLTTVNPPPNDNCGGAIILTPAPICVAISGNTMNAVQSEGDGLCDGYYADPDDDVWFRFTATSTEHTVVVQGAEDFHPSLDVRSGGDCFASQQLDCLNESEPGGTAELTVLNLVIGTSYLVRVFDWYGYESTTPTFTICVLGPSPPGVCDGGQVSTSDGLNALLVCKDGIPDSLVFQHATASSASSAFVLCDDQDAYITLLSAGGTDFDLLPMGIYRVYAISYEGNLTNLIPGTPVSSIGTTGGCLELSGDPVEVVVDICSGVAEPGQGDWRILQLQGGEWSFSYLGPPVPGSAELVLVDATGRVVLDERFSTLSGSHRVAVPRAGVYMAQLTTDDGRRSAFRLIVP